MPYRVLIDIDCLDVLPRSGKRRDEVLDFCSDLAEALYDASDFKIIEPQTQREVEVSEVAGFAVVWWVDAPVKRVIVIAIHPHQ